MNAFKSLSPWEFILSLIVFSFCVGTVIYRIFMTPMDTGLLFISIFILVLGVMACRTAITSSPRNVPAYYLFLLIACVLSWLSLYYAVVCYWGLLFLLFVFSSGVKHARALKSSKSFLVAYSIVCAAIALFGFNSMYYGMKLIDTLRNISGHSIDKIMLYDVQEMVRLQKLPDEPKMVMDSSSGNLQPLLEAFRHTTPWSIYKNQPPQSYVTVIQHENKTVSWFILKIDDDFQTVFIQLTSKVRDQSLYGTYHNDALYALVKNELKAL